MTTQLLLGVDVGTSGVKVVLCNLQGECIAQALREYPFSQPAPGFTEQDPALWWNGAVAAIQAVLAQAGVNASDVAGIGLTGQMHSMVLLDESGSVIRPAILWNDQRTQAEVDWIAQRIGVEQVIEWTANPPLTNFTATKLLWVRTHEPENYARIHRILLAKDYIRYKLTGEFASDVSDASGTLLLDVVNRRWSDEMCKALEVPMEWLPKVYESAEVTGAVSAEASALTGLAAGTRVVAGAGDQAAGAVGNGIVEPGVVSSTIGTSGVVFAHADTVVMDPRGRLHAFCHAVPGAWHVMGVTQSAGGSLQWFRNEFGQLEKSMSELVGRDPYELLASEAEQAPAGSEGLVFLPYLTGERTPHLDPNARGVFFGISPRHHRAHMIRAVMEGVAFSLRDCLDLIQALQLPVTDIRVSGGGARSPLWRQIQADVFGQPVSVVQANEGPAFGAAILAGVGVGCFSSVAAACQQLVHTGNSTTADPGRTQVYARSHALYKSLYQALKPEFAKLAEVL